MAHVRKPKGSLLEELRYAAGRLLPKMFLDVANDAEEYPILARLAQAVEPDLWVEDPTRALLVMMRHAVVALPDETAEKCAEGSTWQHLGRLLYFGSEVNSSLKEYREYVAAAAAYSGRSWDANSSRLTRPVRTKLADKLLDMEQQAREAREKAQALADVPATVQLPSVSTAFVPRPSLDDQFDRMWNAAQSDLSGARPDAVCIVGEPGTGKTRYARERLASAGGVWIDATSGDALSRSLGEALTVSGVNASLLDTPARKHEFGQLLTEAGGPGLVVVDGIADPAEIEVWWPHSIRTRLILTSQTPPDSWPPSLHVGEMEPSEATAMVRSLLREADDREAASLAASLGYRPIAIEQACAFLRRSPDWSIADLVGELARNTATTLLGLPGRTDAALTTIYEETVKTLKEKHPPSYQLVRLLAFVPSLYVPHKLVAGFLAGHLPIEESERKTLELRSRSVTRPLRELCLLEESSSGIRLNSLTKKLLWDLIWPDLLDVLQEYDAATDGVDELELEDLGWSLEEVASFGVIRTLSSTRIREVIATKAQPDEAGKVLARSGKILTLDEWSALTDALWERGYRVAVIERLLKLEDGMAYDDILKWLQPHMDEADRVTAQIPGRDAWLDRINAFDWLSFMEWINRGELTKREKVLTGLKEHSMDEFVLQARIYSMGRAVWMHLADPIVETRLGQIDLRELYPAKDEPEDHDQPFSLTNPPVVLAVEGKGATCHAPMILQALGYSDASELLRVIDLNNSGLSRLRVLVGMVTMAIASEKLPSTPISWRLSKPFTPLIIVVSPKGSFATFEMVEEVRSQLLADTSQLLHGQGVTRPNHDDLNELVNIRVWQESCYEFEHFTDEELADGIITTHQDIDGWSREELVAALAYWRAERQDIESVWMIGRWDERTGRMTGKWAYEVNKPVLALFGLWPTLERKVKQLKAGTEIPTPPIVQVVNDAYQQAQRRRQPSFVLTELPADSESTG